MSSRCGFGLLGGFLGLIFILSIIVGIVILMVCAVKRFTGGSANLMNQHFGGQSPHEILQTCYARGVITLDQHQRI